MTPSRCKSPVSLEIILLKTPKIYGSPYDRRCTTSKVSGLGSYYRQSRGQMVIDTTVARSHSNCITPFWQQSTVCYRYKNDEPEPKLCHWTLMIITSLYLNQSTITVVLPQRHCERLVILSSMLATVMLHSIRVLAANGYVLSLGNLDHFNSTGVFNKVYLY